MINWTAIIITLIVCVSILAIFAMSIINERDKRKKASKTFLETIVEQAKEVNKNEQH